LKVIPVIDILNGIAVHAVRGKRHEYKSLQSILCNSVNPLEIAKAFKALGFSELYIADLDAIQNEIMNFQVFKSIAKETGLSLMVDAGVASIITAEKLLDNGVSKAVIGTETLQTKSFVGEAVQLFGSEHVVVSLDLKDGKILVKSSFDDSREPMSLMRDFKEMGASEVIVLDLARVGSGEGVDTVFMRKVLKETSLDIFVGGGVRDIRDLVELKKLGVSGVLVATALHSGKISIEELKKAKLL
jgi:phosphoribosylformimino-5-aminoimidazole carboxamide ribotide isomerase